MIEHNPVDALDIAELRSEMLSVMDENAGRNRGFIVSADAVAALLNVVEALADLNPTIGYVRHGIGDCPLCGVAVPHHLGKCPVKMAVALVGPTSDDVDVPTEPPERSKRDGNIRTRWAAS